MPDTMTESEATPTLYEWAGGAPAFSALTEAFYRRVLRDELLRPLFEGMEPTHPEHVATWLAEVFGGPARYTEELDGYERMLSHHRNLGITADQRRQFVALMSRGADDAGLPDDPEFRSALLAYLEWGTRLAMHNSGDATDIAEHAPVPRWGWGEAPPYQP
jgi:hemoglobin